MGVTPLTITPNDVLSKFLLPILTTLTSTVLEALIPKGDSHPLGTQQYHYTGS